MTLSKISPDMTPPPQQSPIHRQGFDVDAWFATPEMVASSQKMMLEIVISWEGGVLDICHYRSPKRITFGTDPRADFCYSLGDPSSGPQHKYFPLIEPAGKGFMLGFHTEMSGTIEHNGETFTFLELVKAGRAHHFHRTGCCHYPLTPGAHVEMDLNGLEINMQFVPAPPIKLPRIRQLGFQAPVLSFSVIAHLLFVLFAVMSATSPTFQPKQNKDTNKTKPAPKRLIYLNPIHLNPSPTDDPCRATKTRSKKRHALPTPHTPVQDPNTSSDPCSKTQTPHHQNTP